MNSYFPTEQIRYVPHVKVVLSSLWPPNDGVREWTGIASEMLSRKMSSEVFSVSCCATCLVAQASDVATPTASTQPPVGGEGASPSVGVDASGPSAAVVGGEVSLSHSAKKSSLTFPVEPHAILLTCISAK